MIELYKHIFLNLELYEQLFLGFIGIWLIISIITFIVCGDNYIHKMWHW